MAESFESWCIVEVMGHQTYAEQQRIEFVSVGDDEQEDEY